MATGGFTATDHVPQKHPATYRNPPPYRPDTSASMIDLPVSARDTNIVPVRHMPRSATTEDVNQESQASTGNPAILEDKAVSEEDIEAHIVQPAMAYVIDTSTRSTDRTLFPHVENETISNTLHQRFTNDLLSPEHSICERDIFEVTLNKHPNLGIGITIVGGDIASKHDFGIFVKSVTVDGPAFQDGRIKPGDRLIAINDQNLEGMQHHEAVTLIKESGNSVKLLISQVRPPGSLKRRDDIDIDDEDADEETNIEAEKLSVRTNKGDKEEPKSFAECAERSDYPNVHNVQSCSSVYKDGNLNKSDSKKLQNDKNNEKNVDPVDRKSSIPDLGSAAVDQDRPLSATVDAHSTLSEVESLYSEMSVSKLPKDLQDDSDGVGDSDTDSDFDDVVNKVIENTYRPVKNNATTRNRVMDVDSDSEEAEQFEVFLEKQNGSFGLNVTGGVNTSVRHGGIYVKSVMKDSAADRNSSIRKGDRILEVDGESLEGFTHKQAVQALCNAPPRCALKLQRSSRSRTSSSSSHMSGRSAGSHQNNAERLKAENRKDNSDLPEDIYSIFVTEENTYTVDLTKGSYGLGFSTVGGHLDQHDPLEERVVRIKRVFPIGPAADSRAIHSGDVILAVNGYSVAGLSHTETMSRLRGAGKQVQLLLCHPDPDQLPPLMHLESEESLEITPTDSATNVTDTDSDTDSDLEVTPRREALITPPSGFALSPYPKDEDGLLMPKIASPPPLPSSPPPTLLSTTGSGDSDTPRGEEIEVQIGVAELMDSCRSEMVLIHNAKKNASAQQLFNGSLVVREDSEVTLNSREVTPVVLESSREVTPVMLESSREATPCVNVADDITQADNTESETEESEIEDETNELAKSKTVSESRLENLEITSTLTSTYQSDGSHNDNAEETDNDSLTRTDLSTLVNIDRPEIEQADDMELSLVNTGTFTVEQANRDMIRIKDVLGGAIVNKNTMEKNVHSKESLYLNKDYVQISQNVEEINSDSDEESSSEEDQDSDTDIKRLEEKYIELQNEEDDEDSNSNDDDDIVIECYDATDSANHSRNNDEENTDIVNLDRDQQGSGNFYVNIDDKSDISKSNTNVDDDADDHKDDNEDDEDEDDNENECEKDNNNGDDDDSYDSSEKEDTIKTTTFARKENNVKSLQDSESPVIENAEDEIDRDVRDESDESVSDHSSVRESLSPTLEIQPLNPGEFEVTLTKPEGRGLGFTVAGGAKTTGGCYVKAVLQNPALSDGNLKPGDKLIMVNGIDMRPLNHFEAVSVLRETQDEVTIRVYRAELAGEDTGQAGVDNFPTSQGLAELGIISDQQYDDGNEPDSLRSMTSEGSYTDQDDSGALQDLIASLEESLDQARISEMQPDNLGNQTENVWRDKSVKETKSPKASRSTPTAEASVYEIDLEKPVGGGLGISLVTAQTQNQTGIFISTITPGGVADLDGRLQVGDKILRINGESLIGMNHTKAATMLRSSQGQLSLTVSRKGRKPVLMESNKDQDRSRSNSEGETQGHSENEGEGDTDDNADGKVLENVDSLIDVSDVNASLSITQHVPSDVEDDDVDDLVNKAEQILRDAEVKSDSESENNDTDLGDEVTAKKAHQYLSASEVIDYHSQEIDEDTEQQNDPDSRREMTGNDQEPDSETQDLETSAIEGEIQENSDKCWCNLLRSLDIVVPDEVTSDWLLNLSLVTVPDNMTAALVNIVSNLQEKIDKDDPNEEFKQLRNVPSTDDCTAATMPHNRPKNRFRNVLPFDVNRVKISDDEETDYINASYVQLEVGEAVCDYIVCQGPLPETTDDFWGMIWQEEVTVIAMLTLDMEAMKVKCHRYWPDSVDTPIEVCGGKLQLSLLYQNSLEDFDIRSILVENLETGDNRCVYHLNYTTWPDHGTPASAVPLLQCMRLCHLYRSSGPVVVHCSAGIGRSGTFITIDVALAHVELGYEFDILEIVQELRRQRQGMIQTRDQYTFCYAALVEALTDTPS